MSTPNVQTQSGNRIVVELDGKRVGLVQSLRANDSFGLQPASGIGDIHVVEHVPSVANHSISVGTMVLFTKNLARLGIVPENGDAALKGLVLDIVYYSRDTGEVLLKYTKCSFDSGDVDVSAHRIVTRNAQFKAIDRVGTGL